MPTKCYRTGWISDVHLGTRGCKAEQLLEFLRTREFETLYVVGDLIDVWALRRGIYWPQAHNDVIQKLLRLGRKGTRIIYIPGNHDEFIAGFFGDYGAVTVVPRAIHTTADGRRLLVIHGHELDAVVQNIKWMAHLGDVGYQLLLAMNGPLNWLRRICGLGYWSLSAYVKMSVKNAVSFIGKFEKAIVEYGKSDEVDGVVCGHIHAPVIREIEGVMYYNSGDWVESLSALLEDFDGRIELLTQFDAETRPPAPQEDAETLAYVERYAFASAATMATLSEWSRVDFHSHGQQSGAPLPSNEAQPTAAASSLWFLTFESLTATRIVYLAVTTVRATDRTVSGYSD